MIRSQLIDKIHQQFPHLRHSEVELVVSIVFDSISDALAKNKSVAIRGLGKFLVKHRRARMGRNPKTGEWVNVPAKNVPLLKPGKKIHRLLNPENSESAESSKSRESPKPNVSNDEAVS